MRVLVVEDDRDLNRQLVAALTDAGVPIDWKLPLIPEIPGLPTTLLQLRLPPAVYLACTKPPRELLAPSICAWGAL